MTTQTDTHIPAEANRVVVSQPVRLLSLVAAIVVLVAIVSTMIRPAGAHPGDGPEVPTSTTAVEPLGTEFAPARQDLPPAIETEDADDTPTPAELTESVVMVAQVNDEGEILCTGSGTIVSHDGLVLTNFHVVGPYCGAEYAFLAVGMTTDTRSEPEFLYRAAVVSGDPELDLAVLWINEDLEGNPVSVEGLRAAQMGSRDDVEVGESLFIVGYPGIGGDTVTVTTGLVSGFVEDQSWIKTDAAIAGGNSGGAAFDSHGRLIGVPTQLGAGDNELTVECRPIADSNLDGIRDESDPCISVGGFINSLRPTDFALPFVDAAATAPPMTFDQVAQLAESEWVLSWPTR